MKAPTATVPYPSWRYLPAWSPPAPWTPTFVEAVRSARPRIESAVEGHGSDEVLARLAEELVPLGYEVETGKKHGQKLPRPVFFGDQGRASKTYDIDAYHPGHRVAVEVEAGRTIANNAIYKDLVEMWLMADVDYGALVVPLSYRKSSFPYAATVKAFGPIFASPRLRMPLKGLLVVGY